MSDEFTKEEGNALWQQAISAARPGPGQPVSALDLAAWLDGRADQALAGRVEAALAADPVLVDLALAVPEAVSDADRAGAERLFVRARALVAPAVRGRANGGLLAGLGRWRRTAEWAMVGLSLMVTAAAGLWIGGDIGDSLSSQAANVSVFGDDGGYNGYNGVLSSNEDL